MSNKETVIAVAVIAAVTALLRFLPFIIFGEKRKTPPAIAYLGRVLPYAIMGMLVVYCLKDISFVNSPFGIPELACCAVTALVHVLKRNTLLSVGTGTVLFMVLTRLPV